MRANVLSAEHQFEERPQFNQRVSDQDERGHDPVENVPGYRDLLHNPRFREPDRELVDDEDHGKDEVVGGQEGVVGVGESRGRGRGELGHDQSDRETEGDAIEGGAAEDDALKEHRNFRV